MLQKIREQWLHRRIERTRSICVTFTGGLGAQILSSAIYYHFVQRGFHTVADLSYFNNEHRIAKPGETGQISHWNWEMSSYGMRPESLARHSTSSSLPPTLQDGALKFSLAMQAARKCKRHDHKHMARSSDLVLPNGHMGFIGFSSSREFLNGRIRQ